MNRPSVLVVDDEQRYRSLVELNLTRRGYHVEQASDGLGALNALEATNPDLVILDVMLPDMDGYEVCRRIRAYSSVPIIMLTAKAEEAQKVRGLQLGADDYVTKPFGAEELLARVEAVLRRGQGSSSSLAAPPVRTGDLVVDIAGHVVLVRGETVELTPGEYKLLALLALNVGHVVVQDEILRSVWGPGYEGDTPLLHTLVRRLRSMIEPDPARPCYLVTKRGIGYLLARLPHDDAAPQTSPMSLVPVTREIAL